MMNGNTIGPKLYLGYYSTSIGVNIELTNLLFGACVTDKIQGDLISTENYNKWIANWLTANFHLFGNPESGKPAAVIDAKDTNCMVYHALMWDLDDHIWTNPSGPEYYCLD